MSHLRSSSWTWLLILFTVAALLEVVFWGQVTAFTPIYLQQIGIPSDEIATWTGAIAAISMLVGIPFLPFWGALADRYSRKPVIVRSFVAHMLAGVIMLASGGNIWIFVLGRAISGFALGNNGLMMTTLSERTPPNRLGLAFGVMNSAPFVGAFLGPLLGGRIVDMYGLPTLIAIDVVFLLAVIVVLTFGYTDSFQGTRRGTLVQMAIGGMSLIWQSPRLRLLFPALFVLQAGWMLAVIYVPLVVQEVYHGTELGTATGIVVGAGGFIALILSPLLGALGDRFGYWRVMFTGALISVAIWPLPWITRDLVSFGVVWAIINGLSVSIFAISFTVLANSTASSIRGRVMTFSYLPVNLGLAFGPAVGLLVTQISLFAIFPAAGVITLVGVGMLYLASRRPVMAEPPAQIAVAPTPKASIGQ